MNIPETINIEKYAENLNNLIGVDSAYFQGDKDVDAILELIVAAKKLENRVKELETERDQLKRLDGEWTGGRYNDWNDNRYEEMCSVCGRYSTEYGHPYCPHCGSHMLNGGE